MSPHMKPLLALAALLSPACIFVVEEALVVGPSEPPATVPDDGQGEPLPVTGREMVSEPVCPGAVQVTRDGQCIILGVDGQTIGGYPKIAQIISADLDALGQLRPGESVQFRRVRLEEAEELYYHKQNLLRERLVRVRLMVDG